MKTIDVMIYSKDRPCQLDLLLRSIKDQFLNVGKVAIIYKYSNVDFEKGYDKVFSTEYGFDKPLFTFKEYNFSVDLKSILLHLSENVLFLCDDDVFIAKTELSDDILEELEDARVNAISLKSGLHLTHQYPNIKVELPTNFIKKQPYLMWEWKHNRPDIDWGYPTCINSFIFNKSYYLELLNQIEFNHPTILEARLNTHRDKLRPIMVGLDSLKVLNIPCNRLQTVNDTPYGIEYSFTIEELNSKFLTGYRISTKNIYDKIVDRPNLDIAFEFEKE